MSKPRDCLKCGKQFYPAGRFNRLCNRCNEANREHGRLAMTDPGKDGAETVSGEDLMTRGQRRK